MSGLSSLGLADISDRAHNRLGLGTVDQYLKPILAEAAHRKQAINRLRERLTREVEESQAAFRERMTDKHWCY